MFKRIQGKSLLGREVGERAFGCVTLLSQTYLCLRLGLAGFETNLL